MYGPVEHAMNHLYKAHHITLHVRESNKPAISLYKDNLGFEQTGVEKGYCESSIRGMREVHKEKTRMTDRRI